MRDNGIWNNARWRAAFLACALSSVLALFFIENSPAESAATLKKTQSCPHFQLCGSQTPLKKDGIHDPSNEAINVLQPPAKAMVGFPRTSTGVIDWVKVLDEGYIEPRTGLHGDEKMYSVDFDVIFKNTASMPYVRFPHKPHTRWLTCANCHPKIFLPERGKNHVTMAAIMSGEYCGVCHGKVAFPPLECTRCHRVPRETTGLR